MSNQGKIVVAQSVDKQWYFKLVAENGRTLLTSETYKNKHGVAKGIKATYDLMNQDEVRVEMKSGKFVKNLVRPKKKNFCDKFHDFFKIWTLGMIS